MRREWKIGETNVGIVGDSGGRGIKPYWHTYATRDLGEIRIEAAFWEQSYADTESGAEAMVVAMAEVLNAVKTDENQKLRRLCERAYSICMGDCEPTDMDDWVSDYNEAKREISCETPTAAAAWAGVTDPDAWLEEVRGQNNLGVFRVETGKPRPEVRGQNNPAADTESKK